MNALWPEVPEGRREFEVVATVPRDDDGQPLVPRSLPDGVLGCWSVGSVIISVTVLAGRPSAAVAAAEVLVPEIATATKVEVTARAAPEIAGEPAAEASGLLA